MKKIDFQFISSIAGYVVIIAAVTFGLVYLFVDSNSSKDVIEQSLKLRENISMQEELKIEDLVVGNGTEATSGKEVTVHYTGTLTDGTKFDSSLDRKEPFIFNLGAGEVIAGWDQGVVGMKVGGKRRLTIPSSLAYGESGAGGVIGPNATLIFEISLLGVK